MFTLMPSNISCFFPGKNIECCVVLGVLLLYLKLLFWTAISSSSMCSHFSQLWHVVDQIITVMLIFYAKPIIKILEVPFSSRHIESTNLTNYHLSPLRPPPPLPQGHHLHHHHRLLCRQIPY